jgi:hypothetical protein
MGLKKQSSCPHVYLLVARQRLGKKKSEYPCYANARYELYRGKEYTYNNGRTVGRVVFYEGRFGSRKVGD